MVIKINIKGMDHLIHTNSIYQHYKGDLYKCIMVTYDKEDQSPRVIYSKCTEKGIYISLRDEEGNVLVNQPFDTTAKRFIEKFKFIKQL